MAKTAISRKTLVFYEGEENLLEAILEASSKDKRDFTSYIKKTLSDILIEGKTIEIKDIEPKVEIPQETTDALKGW